MYWLGSIVLQGVYLLLPAVSLLAFLMRRQHWLARHVAGAWISGSVLAGAVMAAYVLAIGGRPAVTQVLLAMYLAVAMMLMLKVFDLVLRRILHRSLRLGQAGQARRLVGGGLRLVILGAITLPWVMSALMVYRPRVVSPETPRTIMRTKYDDVTFPARDGTQIAGWFLRAKKPAAVTVLLCHGLGASKASMWTLMQSLHDSNINVLTIDLRAHGESRGQLCTFGRRETLDVLGAMDWLKANHPDESQRVVGVGASLGAATLLSAAGQDNRFDAIAAIGTFDSLQGLSRDISNNHLVPPLNWLARSFGLPLASLHSGVNLSTVRPADDIVKVWPRPVLVVHGTIDEIIPFDRGRDLFDAAAEPKQSMWLLGTHNSVLDDNNVVKRVVEFVRYAEPVPVVWYGGNDGVTQRRSDEVDAVGTLPRSQG